MNVLVTESGMRFAKGYRFELYKSLKAKGHTLCFLDQNISDTYIDDEGNKHIPLSYVVSRENRNPFREVKFISSLRKIFQKEKIDCILIYGIKIIPAMSIAAKLAGVKKIVSVINGVGNLFMGDNLKIKTLRLLALPTLKVAFSICSEVLVQNQDDLEMLIEKHLVSKKKVKRTPGSGVNLERYPISPIIENNNFLLVTRITAAKGISEFIEAANKVRKIYPNANFHLVGPKDESDKSIDWKEMEFAISKGFIQYHGATKDVASFIKESRIFIFPSYYREGIPRAVLEAMSMGRPIITTNSPGCRETVKEGVNGFLIPPKNSSYLSEKIIWMIEHPEEVNSMARESRRIAEETFDINKVNDIVIASLTGNNL
ncbi:hypothetical protein CN397_06000 [Priestia megaterium]|uniref:glycosyltransferase family 4 protein n=1 Tax=Priestia megaterium TaxID=1404 RepID=UPI000BF3A338|nr:glycosyltransferase family 4 protein [Priestia megaterium]PEU72428.1 hypothetical protein CN397_06000 [Priestia megaterium]